eukprot:5859812-Prymnesium_polylepis.1
MLRTPPSRAAVRAGAARGRSRCTHSLSDRCPTAVYPVLWDPQCVLTATRWRYTPQDAYTPASTCVEVSPHFNL